MNDVGVPITQGRWVGEYPDELSDPVSIGSDVWIGYGATILSGVSLGDSCVIGAGALVTSDVQPNSVMIGSPARMVRNRFSTDDLKLHWTQLAAKGAEIFCQDGLTAQRRWEQRFPKFQTSKASED